MNGLRVDRPVALRDLHATASGAVVACLPEVRHETICQGAS
jgi:hypothetical protein